MPSLQKTSVGNWRCLVRRKGHPVKSKTFSKKSLALQWGISYEASLLEQRVIRSVSVGFSVQKAEPITDENDKRTGGYRFLKSTLLEVSAVSVPANSEALLQVGT